MDVWDFSFQNSKQLYHPVSGQCLDCDKERHEIYMSKCDPSIDSQQWLFETSNKTALMTEWNAPIH